MKTLQLTAWITLPRGAALLCAVLAPSLVACAGSDDAAANDEPLATGNPSGSMLAPSASGAPSVVPMTCGSLPSSVVTPAPVASGAGGASPVQPTVGPTPTSVPPEPSAPAPIDMMEPEDGPAPDPTDPSEPEPTPQEPETTPEPVPEPGTEPTPEPAAEPETSPVEPEPSPMVDCTGVTPEMPPADLQPTLDRTWEEMTGQLEGMTGARPSRASVLDRMDLIMDKVMAGDGHLDYCVRYNSDVPVTVALRDGTADALQRGANVWFDHLDGYDCFPYTEITVSVVGWAANNAATFEWDGSEVPVFVDGGDIPDCDIDYDLELRMTEGLGFTGFGENWGQEVDRSDYMANVDGVFHIWVHEFGHGFGMPDYYDWDVWGGGLEGPNSVMVAGRAITATEWDGWMLRKQWREFKDRY